MNHSKNLNLLVRLRRRPKLFFITSGLTSIMFCAGLCADFTEAATIRVNKDGSGDYTTIRAAINAAEPGDSVVIANGDYQSEGIITPSHGKCRGESGNLITIRAENVRHATVQGFNLSTGGSTADGCSHTTIEGFNITGSPGITIGGRNSRIQNCYFSKLLGTGIKFERPADNCLIKNNEFYRLRYAITTSGTPALSTGSNGCRVQRNVFRRMTSPDAESQTDCIRILGKNLIVQGNAVYDNVDEEIGGHSDFVQSWGTNSGGAGLHDSIIEENIVEGMLNGVMTGGSADDFNNNIIRNNVFSRGSYRSSKMGIALSIKGGQGSRIYNNTIIDYKHGWTDDGSRAAISISLQNNIVLGCTRPFYIATAYPHAIACDYNLYYQNEYPPPAQFRGANDVYGDPKLVDRANAIGKDGIAFTHDDGYRLALGSAAVDVGRNLGGTVDKNILGTSRPAGYAIDMGADEYIPLDTKGLAAPVGVRIVGSSF